MAAQSLKYILGLDVGDKRIGIALANSVAKIPSPLAIVVNDNLACEKITQIIKENNIELVVVGLPIDQNGDKTNQTKKTQEFVDKLSGHYGGKIVFSEESLSSKHDVAACFILEGYLEKEFK
jgi:putative holliday junction resolvase